MRRQSVYWRVRAKQRHRSIGTVRRNAGPVSLSPATASERVGGRGPLYKDHECMKTTTGTILPLTVTSKKLEPLRRPVIHLLRPFFNRLPKLTASQVQHYEILQVFLASQYWSRIAVLYCLSRISTLSYFDTTTSEVIPTGRRSNYSLRQGKSWV